MVEEDSMAREVKVGVVNVEDRGADKEETPHKILITEAAVEAVPQQADKTLTLTEGLIQPQTPDIRDPGTLTSLPSSPAGSTGTGVSPLTSAWSRAPAPGASFIPRGGGISNETGTSPKEISLVTGTI